MGKFLRKIKKYFFNKEEKNIEIKKFVLMHNVEFFNSTIGDFSYIARNSIVHNTDIGKFCSIGPNIVIGYGDHPLHLLSTSTVFYDSKTTFDIRSKQDNFNGKERVKIGNDVWIGANVFIKNGISIGNGAVIGAGAVVLDDIPPYAIAVGVPAKILRNRFDEEFIDILLKSEWWNYSDDFIKMNFEILSSDKRSVIKEFLEKNSRF